MKTMVTGGTGFVGSHLLEALGRRGLEVRALARSPARAAALGLAEVEWVPGHLEDSESLRAALRGADLVFHVAGAIAARTELEYFAINRDGTERLVRYAGENGARLVLVSSLAAAGPSRPGRPLQGDEPPGPVTAYGRSKLAAEQVVRESGLAWTIVRPPTVYGPRDRELLRMFRAVKLGVAPVFGDGSQELSLIYASDLAEALVAAGTTEQTIGNTYFAAHPDIVTAAELVRRVGSAGGRTARVLPIPAGIARGLLHLTGAAARLADRATLLNPDKANEFLAPAWTCQTWLLERDTGWRASHGLDAGLATTWEWYRREKWL